jgi:agmatine/peptidylarginine deiminase
LDFCDLASFILDPNAVVIQNTDECDDKEYKQMQRMIISYVRKNQGKCFVDWPAGG